MFKIFIFRVFCVAIAMNVIRGPNNIETRHINVYEKIVKFIGHYNL